MRAGGLAEAQAHGRGCAAARGSRKEAPAPFSLEDLQAYLESNAAEIRKQPGFEEIAAAVERLAGDVGDAVSAISKTWSGGSPLSKTR